MTIQSSRLWEIDTLRGIAVIMMVGFHFFYDLNYFHFISLNLYAGPLLVYVYFVATMFLFLVGVSLTLSYSKAKKILTKTQIRLKFLRRGLLIFGLGMLITLATWIYLREGFIVFGVLHCIGISILLAYPLIRFRVQPFIIGIIFIALGISLKTLTFNFPWLLWAGFTPSNFYTVDYYPLLPWLGVILVGVSFGNTFYAEGRRHFTFKEKINIMPVRFTSFLGRHSLIIYLLHQPILVGALTLIIAFH